MRIADVYIEHIIIHLKQTTLSISREATDHDVKIIILAFLNGCFF